jgi:hypothetical protein
MGHEVGPDCRHETALFSSTAICGIEPMNRQNSKPRAIAIARTREVETARLWHLAYLSLGACCALALVAAAALLG